MIVIKRGVRKNHIAASQPKRSGDAARTDTHDSESSGKILVALVEVNINGLVLETGGTRSYAPKFLPTGPLCFISRFF